MNNPFFHNRNYLFIYFGAWLAISVIHVLIVYFNFNISLYNAIIDSVVFNVLFSVLGLIIWFPVFYNERGKNEIVNMLLIHLVAGSIIIGIWYTTATGIVELLKANALTYNVFLAGAFSWRIPLGMFFYIVITLIYYLILFYDDAKERVKREAELQRLITEAELHSLRAQINPHFLFNSLNSINTLTLVDPKKAQQMIIKLSDYMRYSLQKDKGMNVSLKEELNNIHLYTEIEKTRFGKKLQVQVHVTETLLDVEIPHMILQPVVENAIKYGMYESIGENTVAIDIFLKDDYLMLKVTNDVDPDMKSNGEGVGLNNIRKRLTLIYRQENLLTATVRENRFETVLRIPVSSNKS